MNWFTFCGYNGNQNVVVKVQAEDEEEARNIIERHDNEEINNLDFEYAFEGKLDELSGTPESFEIPQEKS